MQKIKVEVSARHIHLSQADLDKLFGKGYKLKKLKDLSQTEEFATKEQVFCVRDKNFGFRIVGPVRKESQIELSHTDSVRLKVDAELRLSGDLKNVKSYLEIQGPKGRAKIKVIIPQRHLHCSTEQAKKLKLKKNKKVKIEIVGKRGLVFDNVIVRSDEKYNLACHIDTDEANACGLGKVCGSGYLI
ncbi:MAG: PduL/EutD family phosphate acyltransferase [Patescibacteria group bacterium]